MSADYTIRWPDDLPDPDDMPPDLVAFLDEPEPEHDDAVILVRQ